MAAAIGQSVNIPILIRALAYDIYRLGPGTELWKFSREFLFALDAGTDPDDPTAPVDHYHFAWWRGEVPPDSNEILTNETLSICLANHYIVRDRMSENRARPWEPPEPPADHERHPSLRPDQFNAECRQCRLHRDVNVTAMDRLHDFRHHLHGLKTAQDARAELTGRRAAGLFQLYEAALLKENTVTDEHPAAAEQSPDSAWSLLRLRSKSKGKGKITMTNVVDRVWDEALAELGRLENRPDLKWTWGVDLIQGDAIRLMAGGNSDIHSGYRMSLREGRRAPDSITSAWTDPGSPMTYRRVEIPSLAEENWPDHFMAPPFRHYTADPPTIHPFTGQETPASNQPTLTLRSEIQELRAAIGHHPGSSPDFPSATDDSDSFIHYSVRNAIKILEDILTQLA